MGVYNGYNVGSGGGYNWNATSEMRAQGYYDVSYYLRGTVTDAFEVWDNNVDFNFYGTDIFDSAFVFVGIKTVGSSTETSARTVFNDPDGDGRLGWEGGESYGDGTAFIYLDLSFSDQTDLDKIYEVLMHEIGHVVGLADSSNSESIMNPALDGDPTLSATDKSNLDALYTNLPENTVTNATPTTEPSSGQVTGTSGNDYLTGAETADTLSAGSGQDVLSGNGGTDYLFGGNGNDLIYGNKEIDYLAGGSGNDTIFGGQNSGTARADASGLMRQQDGTETIYGGTGEDLIYGNYGNDIIYGGSGNDTIYGGQNEDTIFGEAGNDMIFGNLGNDTLDGGSGSDTFMFGSSNQGFDVINNFDRSEGDLIAFAGDHTTSSDSAGDVILTYKGGQIKLTGISTSDFEDGWVL
ncbi:matrixin family metalloprotease [Nisaea denitrificans]|uniref:matrixin family metalloprotease n=1 Tax=Nisaea denitrificans TaxID=390877 RepID=UPI000685414C|nr:matrixin family metalloprotease [Nisaea denitrificans]